MQQAPPVANETPAAPSLNTKLAAVKTYQRALGLYYKCGEKWSKDHKCGPQVHLHIVQELWDLLTPEAEQDTTPPAIEEQEQQAFLAISQSAVTGAVAARTVRFSGTVQGLVMQMLLDSGSSSSFISESLAAQLKNLSVRTEHCNIRIAGGGTLSSSATLLNVPWSIGQYQFQSDLRVLPLAAFDMIIGMDWLESFSPM